MNREIPGYYYDPAKKKYFRVEADKTAPAGASWSAASVKRRKLESREAASARKKLEASKKLVQRSKVLTEPLAGGFLNREFGDVSVDVPASGWAKGLREKGEIPFLSFYERHTSPNIRCMYIDGSDVRSGVGYAYASVDEVDLLSSYIPTDENERITFRTDRLARMEHKYMIRNEMPRFVALTSSIKYHRPSHTMILTSRAPEDKVNLVLFSPPLGRSESDPAWQLGACDYYQRIGLNVYSREPQVVSTTTPAPPASSLTCLIGTNKGIVQYFQNGEMKWLTPRHWLPESKDIEYPKDLFSMDFQADHPDVFFAGGRSDRLWIVDQRTKPQDWSWMRHRSSVAHVKTANEHQVLGAGPKSGMSLYDIRFGMKRKARPYLQFPDYRNEEHIDIGLDVAPSLGVVAAAHQDGTVALFSLHSGSKLRAGEVDAIRSTDGPVKSMMFQTMPRENQPSLFVGVGPNIQKYSFGIGQDDEEWSAPL